MTSSLVGSEMCIRDSLNRLASLQSKRPTSLTGRQQFFSELVTLANEWQGRVARPMSASLSK
eukprot:7238283-Prorocentrum_lima.AAC.1